MGKLGEIGRVILDWLYPPKCMYCGRILKDEDKAMMTCGECYRSLELACNIRYLPDCICLSPFYYRGSVKSAIQKYKFHNLPLYSKGFAVPMAEAILKSRHYDFDIITWVPLSGKRLKSRGYDQARLLADELSRELLIDCMPLLHKLLHNKSQTSTSAEAQRRENVKGAYGIINTQDAAGKRILLVDDVCTTGSTLSECVGVLLEHGAQSITCLTIAQTTIADST